MNASVQQSQLDAQHLRDTALEAQAVAITGFAEAITETWPVTIEYINHVAKLMAAKLRALQSSNDAAQPATGVQP